MFMEDSGQKMMIYLIYLNDNTKISYNNSILLHFLYSFTCILVVLQIMFDCYFLTTFSVLTQLQFFIFLLQISFVLH